VNITRDNNTMILETVLVSIFDEDYPTIAPDFQFKQHEPAAPVPRTRVNNPIIINQWEIIKRPRVALCKADPSSSPVISTNRSAGIATRWSDGKLASAVLDGATTRIVPEAPCQPIRRNP
jgi:hypothetical protein